MITLVRLLRLRYGPRAGRFTPNQCAAFGRGLTKGCGYICVGNVALLFNLPKRFEKHDPTTLTLADLNARLRVAHVDTTGF